MEEQKAAIEKTQKDVEELKEKMEAILLALEKGKFVADSAQPSSTVGVSFQPHPPIDGFTPQCTTYNPLYNIPVDQMPFPFPAKGDSAPFASQVGFQPIKEDPTKVTITIPNLDDPEVRKNLKKEESSSSGKFENLEERLRVVEGTDVFGSIDAIKLCLVPDVVLPAKFKIPEFEKYDGSSCPKSHITMYCRKMAAYIHDEKLLIHCFQDSLTGPASRWYMQLDSTHISTWKNLANSFLKQYKHNIDMAPDRMDLQRMEKESTESFKEYAQRWRDTAAQVQPPLTDKELSAMFINTLKEPFYDRMIGSASNNFSDIMTIGERIEYGIKHGKITSIAGPSVLSTKKTNFSKKKEGEVQVVSRVNHGNVRQLPHPNSGIPHYPHNYYAPSHPYYQPYVNHATTQYYPPLTQNSRPYVNQGYQPRGQQNSYARGQENNKGGRKPTQFDPIPMTYTELLPQLFQNNQLAPVPIDPLQPPYPKWYDPNARCDYHAGAIGHSTENCTALKYKVQALIKAGWINFKKDNGPDVNNNPLPNHQNPQVNALDAQEICLKDVMSLRMSKGELFQILFSQGYVEQEGLQDDFLDDQHDENLICLYHAGAKGHSINQCSHFHQKVQELLDSHFLIVSQKVVEQPKCKYEIDVVEELPIENCSKVSLERKPLTIFYKEKPKTISSIPRPITIEVPAPFEYKSSKAVPWSYEYKVITESNSCPADNEIGGITRCGRCYTPEELSKNKGKDKGKAKVDEDIAHKVDEPMAMRNQEAKEPASENDIQEFLKLVKQSDYKVIEQLGKTPARISILALLLSSDLHRKTLLDILNQTYVPKDITTENLDNIIGSITSSSSITFTDDEIPSEGTGHTKALHITVKCKRFAVAKVLVDNGSSLNIMPMSTLKKLPVDMTHLKPSTMIVRAFDGARSEVVGDIEVPIQIGPCTFNITFQVMNINSAYSFLLGRPWIHSAGVVPSSLHQRLKFVIDRKLVIVSGQEDIFVSRPSSMPYIEAAEEAFESSFQSFEVANTITVHGMRERRKPQLLKVPLRGGSKDLDNLLKVPKNMKRFGLGYKPSKKVQRREKENQMKKFKHRKPQGQMSSIPHLYESFKFADTIYPESRSLEVMATIEDVDKEDSLVYLCPDDFELNNWTVLELPSTVNDLSK